MNLWAAFAYHQASWQIDQANHNPASHDPRAALDSTSVPIILRMQMSCCTFYSFSSSHMTRTVFLNDDHPFSSFQGLSVISLEQYRWTETVFDLQFTVLVTRMYDKAITYLNIETKRHLLYLISLDDNFFFLVNMKPCNEWDYNWYPETPCTFTFSSFFKGRYIPSLTSLLSPSVGWSSPFSTSSVSPLSLS